MKAVSKSVRISPRKVRLVADVVRSLSVQDALQRLALLQKRAAFPIRKTIESALANATQTAKTGKDNFVIKSILVSEGPAFKRFHPSTRGRVHPYKKRSSHIQVVLEEKGRAHGAKN